VTLRVPVDELARGERTLDSATSRYLVRVHRLRAGDRFVAFDVDAAVEAAAELLEADPRRAVARFADPTAAPIRSPLPVVLLSCLGKGDKPEQVLAAATALGVERVVLIAAERSVPQLAERADARRARWRTVAREAARQSGRGDVPEVAGPFSLAQALDLTAGRAGWVLDPDADVSLADELAGWRSREPRRVLVGPEGGLAPGEIAMARAAGLVSARFGRLVLRTETAVTAVLGALVAHADKPGADPRAGSDSGAREPCRP
jgi:16S rRNA (uracil1498-N3)-methyltransferase